MERDALSALRPDAGQMRERIDQSLDRAVIRQSHGSSLQIPRGSLCLTGFYKRAQYVMLGLAAKSTGKGPHHVHRVTYGPPSVSLREPVPASGSMSIPAR